MPNLKQIECSYLKWAGISDLITLALCLFKTPHYIFTLRNGVVWSVANKTSIAFGWYINSQGSKSRGTFHIYMYICIVSTFVLLIRQLQGHSLTSKLDDCRLLGPRDVFCTWHTYVIHCTFFYIRMCWLYLYTISGCGNSLQTIFLSQFSEGFARFRFL